MAPHREHYFHVSDQTYLEETEYEAYLASLEYDGSEDDEEPDYDRVANDYERRFQ